jgi:HlyD family secretion protein
MKKRLIIFIFLILILISGLFMFTKYLFSNILKNRNISTTSSVKFVNSVITADGTVTAQNLAKLNFQIGGKLVYLPFKEGDKVTQGQTIASLDSYTVREQLKAALNNYRTVRNNFDQNKENINDNLAVAQQTYPYNYYSIAGLSGSDKNNAVNNAIARLADSSQASLDNSVISVELANYALQLSSLISPINGIVLRQDVNVSGVNITPATTFIVADPATTVFRANVPASNIYYISEGNTVTLSIDGVDKKITGIIDKIYPSKIILAGGQAVYQVDIQSDDLKKLAKLDMSGRAMISTNSENVALVPVWTVLSGKYIWTENNRIPQLKEVKTGKIHGDEIEILKGLSASDKIIIDPKFIPSLKYQIL